VCEGRCCTRGLLLLHRPGSAFSGKERFEPRRQLGLSCKPSGPFDLLQPPLRQQLPSLSPLSSCFIRRPNDVIRKLLIDNRPLALHGFSQVRPKSNAGLGYSNRSFYIKAHLYML
jgi:hypothetical protein